MPFGLLMAISVASWGLTDQAATSAEELFRAGRAALRDGDRSSACEAFRRSYRLEPAPGVALNLALCDEAAGYLARAWGLYESVIASLAAEDPRAKLARARAELLDERLARVTFLGIQPLPTGSRVSEAGADFSYDRFGVEVRLDPGAHHFVITAPGHRPAVSEITLAPGQALELWVTPGPALSQPSSPKARASVVSPSGTESTRRTWAVLALGTSASLSVVGALAGVGVLRSKSVVQDECSDRGCSDAGMQAAHRGKLFDAVSTASFVSAVVAGAAGAGLLLLTPKEAQEKRTGHVTWTFGLTPSAAMIGSVVRF